MQCDKCQREVFLPFRCPYCGDYFCSDHRLPENHNCPKMEQARAPRQETPIVLQRQDPYEYTVSYVPVETQKKRIRFSSKEIQHLTVAALLVMGIGLSLGFLPGLSQITQDPFTLVLFTTFLTVSFFVHEIAHKIAAQRHGLWAEFRLTLIGALLTMFSIISPFKIISPGAVMVAGVANREKMGKISIVGPAMNIALSTVFFPLAFVIPQFKLVFLLVAAINSWIALFNLIPFGILDGFKILSWNKKIWALAFTTDLILTIISYWLIM